MQFNAWNCSGSYEWKGFLKGNYIKTHCAIVFVEDPLDSPSDGSVDGPEDHPFGVKMNGGGKWEQYISDLRDMNQDLPIVLVRNKMDLNMHSGWNWSLVTQDEMVNKYYRYNISAKSCYNFEKPFYISLEK